MVGFLQFLKRKRLGSPKHADSLKSRSESTCMDDSTEHEEAPWRATAIVENVPIEEKDWWIINSSNLQLDEEKIDSEAAAAASSESEKMTADNGSDAGTKNTDDEITFHNRGYEIWEHCRDAWRSGSKECDVEDVSSRGTASPRKPMNKKQRERIMLNVTKQREFKLPRKIRLDEMINIYTEVWAVESE